MSYDRARKAFREHGFSWPISVDLELPSTWGLSPGSFISLGLLSPRARDVLFYSLVICKHASQAAPSDVLIVNAERSIDQTGNPAVNKMRTITPGAILMIFCKTSFVKKDSGFELQHVGQLRPLLVEEAFAFQGMPLTDFCTQAQLQKLKDRMEYRDLISICGRAFHMPSVIAALIAGMCCHRFS